MRTRYSFFLIPTSALLVFLSFADGFRNSVNFGSLSSKTRAVSQSQSIKSVTAVQSTVTYFDEVLLLQGAVTNGYGRGSKKLGVPTANLPHFDNEIRESSLTNGVYFGWGYLPSEGEMLGCVANIGKSPTFVNQENPVNIVEAHLLDRKFNNGSDFYGSTLRLCLIGFLRTEQKFSSLDSLVAQINADIQQTRELCMSLDKDGPLGAGRLIAKEFFETPFDDSLKTSLPKDGLIWERRLPK